ncbi:MAG TPA: heparan-alpha-glucosaminide N-acetyltransferase [Bacillota bacterium]|nr:heparan-alpha-glucosaminide N-acetyltransferase [Bacillota bacterium]
MSNHTLKQRFWEIDFWRGIALIMMLIFHFLVDFEMISGENLRLDYGFWSYFQKATAFLFLAIVGLSLKIAFNSGKLTFHHALRRGLKIFLWGCLITLVTKIALTDGAIVFGVLHLIGTGTILAYPMLRYKKVILWLGLIIVIIGYYLDRMSFPFYFLFWLGFVPRGFYSLDYFPLFPWFGLILLGIYFADLLYPGNQRRFPVKEQPSPGLIRWISILGRHTLPIYLIHQPLFMLLIYLAIYGWGSPH